MGVSARLQHPLGVAVQNEATVLVADSYNHKVNTLSHVSDNFGSCGMIVKR